MKSERNDIIEEEGTKSIDIYQHLKLNLKNKDDICDCNEMSEYYCIPCKTSVCKNCNMEEHSKHILIKKRPLELSNDEIEARFKPITNIIQNSEFNKNSQNFKNTLKNLVESFCQKLVNQIEKMKEEKFKEINLFYDGIQGYTDSAMTNLNKIKNTLKDYYKKSHKFFNMDKGNNDENKTIFLINYDLMNLISTKSKELKTLVNNLTDDVKNFQISLDMYGKTVNEEVEKILFGSNNGVSVSNEINNKLIISSDVKKDMELNDEEYNPMNHFKYSLEKLTRENYKDINDRVEKYISLIENVKTKTFNCWKMNKNLKELENEIQVFENNKAKGADSLFSQKKDKGITSRSLTQRDDKADLNRLNYKTKDDVTLNNNIIKKFFSYQTIEMYGQYFKMATKELQSSHADLMIKVDPDEEEDDYAKIIEGTDTIIIYEKVTNKLTKKKVKLNKNPIGYTVFPVGCRCIYINGKVYISGGKDETGLYANVLIYDTKTEKLKRIMDLIEPRCYHTMVYSDVFETILVIGGENCDSVEIFDPLANRWQLLPSLKFPRANVVFHFDKPRGLMFTLFGRQGNILDNQFSDIIEVLDLSNFKRGWLPIEYNNKAEVSLKRYVNVFPLSNYLLLAYGAQTGRKRKRVGVLVNLVKYEIQKIDQKMKDLIYCASKTSRKLNSIVNNMTLEDSKIVNTHNNYSN